VSRPSTQFIATAAEKPKRGELMPSTFAGDEADAARPSANADKPAAADDALRTNAVLKNELSTSSAIAKLSALVGGANVGLGIGAAPSRPLLLLLRRGRDDGRRRGLKSHGGGVGKRLQGSSAFTARCAGCSGVHRRRHSFPALSLLPTDASRGVDAAIGLGVRAVNENANDVRAAGLDTAATKVRPHIDITTCERRIAE